MRSTASRGKLFLVPAPLDFGCVSQTPLEGVIPSATVAVAARLRYWICENAKSTRAYLKRIDRLHPLAMPLRDLEIQELPREVHKKGDHHGEFDARPLLGAALAGNDIGLVSDAGMPAVADPGASVVRAAHDLDIAVEALVGPASLLLALAASGLNGQSFAFVGYLPQSGAERAQRIRELETQVGRTGQTQLFIETPYRNNALLAALLETLKDDTRLAISSGLTLPHARNRSATVGKWKREPTTLDGDTPVVFGIGR